MHLSTERFATVCITRSGQEQYLCTEIAESIALGYRTSPVQSTQVAPQTIVLTHSSHEDLCSLPLFFCAQALPASKEIQAESISAWANSIAAHLIDTFGDDPPPWCLHIFDSSSVETGKQYARAQRIEQALLALLKQRRRSYLRTLVQTPSHLSTLIQVVLVEPTRGYLSVADTTLREIYKASISPALAGYHVIADDKRPPSRAFKKLREAIEVFHLPVTQGQVAVDLGASPGGWTHVLREHGLSVTAIDRSPLETALMRDHKISWSSGNALTWMPPARVDWLVCDVITTPENTSNLLRSWITKSLCGNFCVTVKFKGAPAISTLLSLAAFLRSTTSYFDGRQLTHNKNELTLVGSTAPELQTTNSGTSRR